MGQDNKIDKLFKERLKEDKPAFKEEYWKGFEQLLETVPPAGASASASGLGKILSTLTITKGIIALVAVTVVSCLVYFGLNNDSTNKPAEQITAVIKDSSILEQTKNNISSNTSNPTINSSEIQAESENSPVTTQADINKNSNIEASTSNIKLLNVSKTKGLRKETENQSLSVNKSIPKEKNSESSTTIQDNSLKQSDKGLGILAANIESKEKSKEKIETSIPENNTNEKNNDLIEKSKEVVKDGIIIQKFGETITTIPNESLPEKSKDSVVISTLIAKENLNTDSIANSSGFGFRDQGKSSSDKLNDTRLKFYVIPGFGIYNTIGNSQDFSSATKASFQFGAGLSYALNKRFSLYAEANAMQVSDNEFIKSSLNSDYLFYQWVNTVKVETREFTFMNVPVLLRFNYKQHNISAGPTFRYMISSGGEKVLMDSSFNVLTYQNSKADNYLAGFNRLQTGLALEYSWDFYRQSAILIRYNWMFNEFEKSSYYSGSGKEKMNMLLFAFRFRVY